MRISDWSSDVCSSDLAPLQHMPAGTRDCRHGMGEQCDLALWRTQIEQCLCCLGIALGLITRGEDRLQAGVLGGDLALDASLGYRQTREPREWITQRSDDQGHPPPSRAPPIPPHDTAQIGTSEAPRAGNEVAQQCRFRV